MRALAVALLLVLFATEAVAQQLSAESEGVRLTVTGSPCRIARFVDHAPYHATRQENGVVMNGCYRIGDYEFSDKRVIVVIAYFPRGLMIWPLEMFKPHPTM